MTQVQELTDEQVAELSPGVRDLVVWLRRHGFETTDSGDGSNFKAGMEGALPLPHVVMVDGVGVMIMRAEALQRLLEGVGVDFDDSRTDTENTPRIEATYSPSDSIATLILYNVTSGDICGALMPPPTNTSVGGLTDLALIAEVDDILGLGDQWYSVREKVAGNPGDFHGGSFSDHPTVKRYGELCAELTRRMKDEGLRDE